SPKAEMPGGRPVAGSISSRSDGREPAEPRLWAPAAKPLNASIAPAGSTGDGLRCGSGSEGPIIGLPPSAGRPVGAQAERASSGAPEDGPLEDVPLEDGPLEDGPLEDGPKGDAEPVAGLPAGGPNGGAEPEAEPAGGAKGAAAPP